MKYVYFLQIDNIDNFIKVGTTDNIESRVKNFNIPYKLKVLGYFEHKYIITERQILHLFSDYRISGEWFYPDQFVLDCIDKILKGHYKEIVELYNMNPPIKKTPTYSNKIRITKAMVMKHWQKIGLVKTNNLELIKD